MGNGDTAKKLLLSHIIRVFFHKISLDILQTLPVYGKRMRSLYIQKSDMKHDNKEQ